MEISKMITVELKFKECQRKLKNVLDSTKNGLYSIFIFDDDPEWMTAYHEDTKTEYFLTKERFKQEYKKDD
jgi:hypothetical protein